MLSNTACDKPCVRLVDTTVPLYYDTQEADDVLVSMFGMEGAFRGQLTHQLYLDSWNSGYLQVDNRLGYVHFWGHL